MTCCCFETESLYVFVVRGTSSHTCCKSWPNLAPLLSLQAKRAASSEGADVPAIPVTVRQLEAVIRIAESLAKMQLQVDGGAGLVRECTRCLLP